MFSTSHPPPPIRHHRTTQIPQSRALDLISAYLDAAKATTTTTTTTTSDLPSTNPATTSPAPSSTTSRNALPTAAAVAPKGAALHPNAVLTEAGPVAPAGGVAGLVLRNLERVRAGLKGEFWAAEPGEEGLRLDGSGKGQDYLGGRDMEMDGEREGADREERWEDEWQDKEEFEREQEQEVFVRDEDVIGKDVPDVKPTPALIDEESILVNRRGGNAILDKEARKIAKMKRRKEEKRSRETARENKSSPGG